MIKRIRKFFDPDFEARQLYLDSLDYDSRLRYNHIRNIDFFLFELGSDLTLFLFVLSMYLFFKCALLFRQF